jgi:hypothetical protein
MLLLGLREIIIFDDTNSHLTHHSFRGRRRSQSISEVHRPSGGSVLCNVPDFPDETGLHVENKTPHRNLFGDPRM